MSFSTQSRHSLAYVAEGAYGITPASPSLTQLRHTGCDLALSKKTIESDEIRDDRQIAHLRHSLHTVRGDIDMELSYGTYDPLLAAACCSSWSDDVLKTGTDAQSLTFERAFTDINQYQVFTGCLVDELNLSVQPESLVSGRFSVLGQTMTAQGSPLDAAVDAGSAYAPMDSFSGVLEEAGAALGLVAGIDLKIENGIEPAYVLGADSATAMTAGRSRISGEITAYFEDNSLIAKFINAEQSSLKLSVSGAGGSYDILLPNILYTGADIPVKGDRITTLTLPFVALYDGGEDTNLKITRIPL